MENLQKLDTNIKHKLPSLNQELTNLIMKDNDSSFEASLSDYNNNINEDYYNNQDEYS